MIYFLIIFILKFPNTLLLEVTNSKLKKPRSYWIVRFLLLESIDWNLAQKFLWFENDLSATKLFKRPYKFTLKSSINASNFNFSDNQKIYFNKNFKPKNPSKYRIKYAKHLHHDIYDYLNKSHKNFNLNLFLRVVSTVKKLPVFKSTFFSKINKNFNLIFIKKEKIYTKLKYSRVPQYDAVSGGSAAILAGFLGYLITEKFGLELVDSGDFWFFFMYLVFFMFSCQPLLRIILDEPLHWSVVSYKWLMYFYINLFILFFKFIKLLIKKFVHIIRNIKFF